MIEDDAHLISNFFNILYLTGFEALSPHEREAYVLIISKKKIIITDSRYAGETHSQDSELYILQQGERVGEVIKRICMENKVKSLKCEVYDLRWSELQMLQKLDLELKPLTHEYIQKRSVKTEEEIFAIKQACHIGDLVLKDIIPYIHPGQTEKEIAWYIERSIREGYNAELSFNPIVAVDSHTAIPHYNTKKGEGKVKEDSLILIDFGVKAHNYCSDITRMVGVGKLSDEIINTYSHLLDTQKKTITYAGSTNNLKEIDLYCRKELSNKNLPSYGHSTGHGIGLEVHEAPRLSAVSQDTKTFAQVFTIEPGIYLPGKWGMRIEDTVTVSDQGELEVLTHFPKELVLL